MIHVGKQIDEKSHGQDDGRYHHGAARSQQRLSDRFCRIASFVKIMFKIVHKMNGVVHGQSHGNIAHQHNEKTDRDGKPAGQT